MDINRFISTLQITTDKVKESESQFTSEAQHAYNQGFIQAMELVIKSLRDLEELDRSVAGKDAYGEADLYNTVEPDWPATIPFPSLK